MIRLFHGSNVVVDSPLVGIGREALDFGKGFYVTALLSQAEEWARNKAHIIEGGVANDRVIDTVENYMAGLIDEEIALGLLAQHQPNHQICFTKQEVVERYLHFVNSVQVKAYVE